MSIIRRFEIDGYTFEVQEDMTGTVKIFYKSWGETPVKSIHVPLDVMMAFYAEVYRVKRIQRLEAKTATQLLHEITK
jgi:predicted transposase YdaD